MHNEKFKIATLDFETDPFKYGRVPTPFACGFYDGKTYFQTWGDDCAKQMVDYLADYRDKLIIYAHNGGKFDFCFLEEWITNPIHFINTRLVKGQIGKHQIRDSYAIIPEPLSALQKDAVDYGIFEYGTREIPANKQTISDYLKSDCVYLYGFVKRFIDEFGLNLTIAGTALRHSRALHPFDTIDQDTDVMLRPFYFGGRVQCFEKGAIKGNFKYYDINSSYPYAMVSRSHPIGRNFGKIKTMPDNGRPYFARIIADSDGALPVRTKTGLQFPKVEDQEFFACSHEIECALDLGLLRIKKIIGVYLTVKHTTFSTFIEKCIAGKINAQEHGDKVMRTFYKLLANSSYGKYAQCPDRYVDCKLFVNVEEMETENAELKSKAQWSVSSDFGTRILCERPTQHGMLYNVATGASITSAARATLLRAIHSAKRPLYCDTDSIICESADVEIHPTKLGAWDIEAELDEIYIAGRKLYAGYKNGECIKLAAKGVSLKLANGKFDGETIKRIVSGIPYQENRASPTMRVFGEPSFISRSIRMT